MTVQNICVGMRVGEGVKNNGGACQHLDKNPLLPLANMTLFATIDGDFFCLHQTCQCNYCPCFQWRYLYFSLAQLANNGYRVHNIFAKN